MLGYSVVFTEYPNILVFINQAELNLLYIDFLAAKLEDISSIAPECKIAQK